MKPAVAIRGRRGGPARWLVALAISTIVVAVSAAGFSLLSAGAAASTLVDHVPAGSLAYLEVRLDPPGDQRQNVANVLARFPGFADQSILGTKLDEALDQLLGGVTSGSITFTRDLKPWLGGSMAIVSTRVPASTANAPGLWLVAVTDPAAALRWMTSTLVPETGTSTYGGVALTTAAIQGREIAFGVVGHVLLAGDISSVQAAIDTKGASPFAASTGFRSALGAVPGDQLAFGYVDLSQLRTAIAGALSSAASGGGSTASAALSAASIPDWLAFSLRAESNGLAATIATPQTALLPFRNNHVSTVATRLPPTTIVTGEVHDLAALLTPLVAGLSGSSGGAVDPGGFGPMLGALGGVDGLIGWLGDATVSVIRDGAGVAAGIVVQAPDAATAEAKLLQLRNLAVLAGGLAGVTVRDETYGATTLTIIDAGAVAGLSPVPLGPIVPDSAHLEIVVAQRDELVVVGLGDVFVKAVLDTRPGASLADQRSYRTALDRVGSANVGQLFVDVAGIVDLLEGRMSADERVRFEVAIKPYLAPFEAFASAGSIGDPSRLRFVITVR